MQAYFTPVKELGYCSKTASSSLQAREGDWICLNCNNLNFSFRKKCNRCKVQTKQKNQSTIAYYLNLYAKPYQYAQPIPNQESRGKSHALTSANSGHGFQTPSNNKKNFLSQNKENKTPEKCPKDLPSVSPLVKKYNARQSTPLSELSSDENIWGVARDFQSILASSGRSDGYPEGLEGKSSEEEKQQLQRMLSNIML